MIVNMCKLIRTIRSEVMGKFERLPGWFVRSDMDVLPVPHFFLCSHPILDYVIATVAPRTTMSFYNML